MCARDAKSSKCSKLRARARPQLQRADYLRGALLLALLALAGFVDTYHPLLALTTPISGTWMAAIPWIASAVGALASAYGARKASQAQNTAANQQGDLVGMQRDAANRLMPWGEGLMKQGGKALTSLLPWYTKAAFGDRTQLQQLTQPELREIRENYDRPLQQLTELSPRTGTTAASNASILTGRAEAQNNALLSARMAGIQGLGELGSRIADLGSGAVGAGFGGLQGASSGNLSLLSQLFNLRQQNASDSESIGANVVDFLKQYQQWRANRQATTQNNQMAANANTMAGYWTRVSG